MRLRFNPKAEPYLEKHALYVSDPFFLKGHWNERFQNKNPIYLEIGCGKGQFISQMATQFSNQNYIGIEIYGTILYKALLKLERNYPHQPFDNLLFVKDDARLLGDIFHEGELDGIYLNFSDPWPKKRHASRRLSSPTFLDIYCTILNAHGTIEMKTDNLNLFQYSLETFRHHPFFSLEKVTYDLHHTPDMFENNIMTEYEERFSNMGNPICKLVAKKLSK